LHVPRLAQRPRPRRWRRWTGPGDDGPGTVPGSGGTPASAGGGSPASSGSATGPVPRPRRRRPAPAAPRPPRAHPARDARRM